MQKETLDFIDRKILAELDRDAHISYSGLGKKIRVAKETVKYRIQQLEKRKIIEGYYVSMNYSKLGLTFYRIYLKLQDTNQKIDEEIINHLMRSEKVNVLYRINGPYHIALGVWARDVWEFEGFWSDFRCRFGKNISCSQCSVITEYQEFSRSYLDPKSESEKISVSIIQNTKPEALDEIDFRLLAFLSNNARAPLVKIANALGISVSIAAYRLKTLRQKGVIVGFKPLINLAAIDREYYKVDLWLRKFDREDEVRAHILGHPAVVYTERTLITSDIEFDLEVADFEEFMELLDSFKAKFPDEIRDYSYYSRVKNYKTRYVPRI